MASAPTVNLLIMDEPRFQNALTLQAQVVTSTEFYLVQRAPKTSDSEDLNT